MKKKKKRESNKSTQCSIQKRIQWENHWDLKLVNSPSCSEPELVHEPDVDWHIDDHIQSVIDMRNHRYSRNLQSRKKEKEKKMKRNKMVYKRRDGKYNNKRIQRKMRKYNGNFKRLLC